MVKTQRMSAMTKIFIVWKQNLHGSQRFIKEVLLKPESGLWLGRETLLFLSSHSSSATLAGRKHRGAKKLEDHLSNSSASEGESAGHPGSSTTEP